uniref:Uncharacterized protein n=1 Tax=Anguilla anguilla TaxID=7936 RepID=A0A0E9PMS0_ANGAN
MLILKLLSWPGLSCEILNLGETHLVTGKIAIYKNNTYIL